ncbi:MAG: peroxiredoxin [Myxococcales bacterium]|nr:peroxiredoxin [Myxococcales bacterium]
MSIQVGQSLPHATLHEGTPKTTVDPAVAFSSGKHVLFAVPGAFTPGCDRTHLPGYIADHQALRDKGVDSIACVAVNDAFVMDAWGKAHDAAGKVRMLADPDASFTKALGLQVEAAALGGTRSQRYAMIIEDGVVTHLQVEPDGFGLSCSLAPSIAQILG